MADTTWPQWVADIDGSLAIQSQYVVAGNVHDIYYCPAESGSTPLPFVDALHARLRDSGFDTLFVYDPIDGQREHPPQAEAQTGGGKSPRLNDLKDTISRIAHTDKRIALVIQYASRLVHSVNQLTPDEHAFFTFCEKLARTAPQHVAEGQRPSALYNPIIWVVDSDRDLPHWFITANDKIRTISVPFPSLHTRTEAGVTLLRSLSGYDELDEAERDKIVDGFVGVTEGMTVQSMLDIVRLAADHETPATRLDDAVRSYKVGMVQSPWRRGHLLEQIGSGETGIKSRVLGQPKAVEKTLDILKRSVMGLTGAQASSSSNRPRGVLFFAGPTGVGKTLLAKELARLVFGDATALRRFDMSEFAAEHSDQRLIGAPPSYVGYEAGGELTNHVRQRPFSVILFDEIEKAHPRILDKFLQILEDGRLTDGRGDTVYFSESLLVFTSNLGVRERQPDGRFATTITAEMDLPFDELEDRMGASIADYFNESLQRPELLNRFGDNIVMFNFIKPDVGERIFDYMIRNIGRALQREHTLTLDLADDARDRLLRLCTADLSHGGRGIGNKLESAFINPLARALFREQRTDGQITVTGLRETDDGFELELA